MRVKILKPLKEPGKRWTVLDRDGNPIYLTQERWEHIVDEGNHPEMLAYEEQLQLTLKKGRRRQEPLNPANIAMFFHLMICQTT